MFGTRIGSLVLLFAASALAPETALSAPVEVTACGQVVRGPAFLAADLDCTGSPAEAGVMIVGGRLELGGFTLSGDTPFGVRCERFCRIDGPGAITGSFALVVWGSERRTSVRVHGATLSTSRPNSGAILASGAVTVVGSNLSYEREGVNAPRSRIVDSILVGGGDDGNGIAGSALLVRSSVSGNGYNGIWGGWARLIDSAVTGNGVHSACGTLQPCADLFTVLKPRLRGASTCETSHLYFSGFPGSSWNVCALD